MNRQFSEEETLVADCLQEMKRIINQLHITDESFLEDTRQEIPHLKKLLSEMERYTVE
ncbi:hypothetical protein [Fictibacillus barbaricus]|uniref:Uncharacterized protein n=1 Tax=Fictibacillus barbaricus TaxID=182136 RepID=A0ABS2ZFZ4_9BACL|nr:hypothetical protein [Fictibacillus barbaricus]MBN3547109.1 hypothetical protein [Fictibacillus barbaricus]GGB46510.1 hypothetical protein GCM10007199_09850 [Fictibacillus barbaricus]